MRYVSTRGRAPVLTFDDVLLAGLAEDGGLYVPSHWPTFTPDDIRDMRGLSYQELAVQVMGPFVAGALTDDELTQVVEDAYASFTHPAIAPLRQLGPDDWVMELFHGPTLAFKDYALQVVGGLFDLILARRGERVTVVGATSGDTGSAAIAALRDRAAVDVVILLPKGRVSEVQRRQMTTVESPNVHVVAVDGTFDDCQALVKSLFADVAFRDEVGLGAVNSINWARVMAQTVYYFWAALRLGAPDRTLGFAVPTGNFGNVLAGWVARQMGLPIERLVVGSNRNDILARFLETGTMSRRPVEQSYSPSMDIQVSSNFERLLFEIVDRDAPEVERMLRQFAATGSYKVAEPLHQELLGLFRGYRLDDPGTEQAIADLYAATGEILDPHSAIGVMAGRVAGHRDLGTPMVALATAHPAKFPEVVERATGVRPALPPRLADLMTRPERLTDLPNDVEAVKALVRQRIAGGRA
ncbi:threonine synthase [Pararhodospirillum photometricum]|uniref:Threonine synthase n=1 Tax=Pararhodospirillum photometricum DSM 122 TaxID=1150469 RepID=H6SQP9_PARPM|nr:threonine synthase [Pararhodospirillum photometricum]CCG07364.1 L-threonine synthase [Pararhodospirillum photometricum DSM 122]